MASAIFSGPGWQLAVDETALPRRRADRLHDGRISPALRGPPVLVHAMRRLPLLFCQSLLPASNSGSHHKAIHVKLKNVPPIQGQ